MNDINLVWLKRDLRLNDHACLAAAEMSPLPYLVLYCFEPALIAAPDIAKNHLKFIYHSLLEMRRKLAPFKRPLFIVHHKAVDALKRIETIYKINNIFAHQEHGTKRTWKRDREILKFCNDNNINFLEAEHSGIQRGIVNRENWDQNWFKWHSNPLIENKYSLASIAVDADIFSEQSTFFDELSPYPKNRQFAGEDAAHYYLNSFIDERGSNYHKYISKPEQSRKSCGRISPYLAKKVA